MAKTISNQSKQKKMYVLDTNVLLHDPEAIYHFEGVYIGIPSVVLEELDKFKKEGTERGRNAREVVRNLDSLRETGSLHEGVKLKNGSVLKVLFLGQEPILFPFKLRVEDNEILLIALSIKGQGYHVTFISKDINARIKADSLGLDVEDYVKEHVTPEDFYRGWLRVSVPAVQLKGGTQPAIFKQLIGDKLLTPNQFVIAESQNNPHNNKLFQYRGGTVLREVHQPRMQWPFEFRNIQQFMAMDVLLDDQIQFVTLLGPAGTGKTFLALLAGLHQVLVEHRFNKMLVSRPVVPLGRDVGFLPGELKEKLHNWMLPIYDNMDFIVHSARGDGQGRVGQSEPHGENGEGGDGHHHEGRRRDRGKKDKSGKQKSGKLMPLDELIYRGKVSLEAITYMRGRSIPYQFILIDEAQNLTPHEVKTLVTRVGEGSKIILAGDPYQIDSPYLDFSSNGLVVTSEKFKGQSLFASVYLEISERSELSQLAGKLL